tara:strand:+ start:343 stop:642 length:300 start_codon:yes stop_codon:yes gene_type:complete
MRKIDTQAGVIEYIKDRFETLEAIGTKYEELKGDFHILFYYVMWLETSVIKLRESGYDEDWIKQIEDVIERHVCQDTLDNAGMGHLSAWDKRAKEEWQS